MVCLILGTRAELIKSFPVMLEMEKKGVNYTFIHTGQHSLGELCNEFGVKKPDVVLYEPPKTSSRFYVRTHKAIAWGIPLIVRIRKALRQIKPKYVIYHGDTISTSCGAVASSGLMNASKPWHNCHLESGLRSGDLFEPFPEEINRIVADRFSDTLFTVSKLTDSEMKKQFPKRKVLNVGNTIVDSVHLSLKMARKRKIKQPKGRYALMTVHRHENIKSRNRLRRIVDIVTQTPIKTYWPMHDNTKKKLKEFRLWKTLESCGNIEITSLVPYVAFIKWLSHCDFLMTDGGSIQEESLELKKPCILLRRKTERIEGLGTGINFLIGLDVDLGVETIHRMEHFKIPRFENPYGDGKASKRIVEVLS
jgi:UDP-N-acetylglucosamine 2-epimerase (non-hydrolysing)